MLINGNAARVPLRDGSVQCVVTSPPYWGLRDYGLPPLVWGGREGCVHRWGREQQTVVGRSDGGRDIGGKGGNYQDDGPHQVDASQGQFCQLCNAWRGSLGLEPTPDLYVEHLVSVFREVKRVLRDDGCVWLNLGDSYANKPKGSIVTDNCTLGGSKTYQANGTPAGMMDKSKASGLAPKQLVGIPWRVAFALQADGWWLRSDVIWHKPNCMPESVTDRPTKAHEYLFLLTKAARYYYDAEAVKERANQPNGIAKATPQHKQADLGYNPDSGTLGTNQGPPTRNRRTVWTIPTQSYKGAHFATFPEKLVEPCILAGTSARGECGTCGKPWRRIVEKEYGEDTSSTKHIAGGDKTIGQGWEGAQRRATVTTTTTGWTPQCQCGHIPQWSDFTLHGGVRGEYRVCELCEDDATRWYTDEPEPMKCTPAPIPQTVLDPFAGTATVGRVATQHRRRFVGLELNPEYIDLAEERTRNVAVRLGL